MSRLLALQITRYVRRQYVKIAYRHDCAIIWTNWYYFFYCLMIKKNKKRQKFKIDKRILFTVKKISSKNLSKAKR